MGRILLGFIMSIGFIGIASAQNTPAPCGPAGDLSAELSTNVASDSRCFELRMYTAEPEQDGVGGINNLHKRFREQEIAIFEKLGAEVVAAILGDSELKGLWQEEVEGMRSRIASLRIGLVEALAPHGLAERFAHVGAQRGMFSYTGLSPQQVARLRDEHAVYLVSSGRANVAGLDARRLDRLAQAIAQVCAD